MIAFPSTAYVGRILPKEAFYKQLRLSGEVKDSFVSDVQRLRVDYSLTAQSLRIDPDPELTEILVLTVQLKTQDPNGHILEAIARQNPHKLLFQLVYEDQARLALYHSKLYQTPWQGADRLALELRGRTLSGIWQGFLEQIVLDEPSAPAPDMTIEDRIRRQEKIARLNRDIAKAEQKVWKETQPGKRFELYQQVQRLKKQLEEIEHG